MVVRDWGSFTMDTNAKILSVGRLRLLCSHQSRGIIVSYRSAMGTHCSRLLYRDFLGYQNDPLNGQSSQKDVEILGICAHFPI